MPQQPSVFWDGPGTCCRDLIPFSPMSISEVIYWCWAVKPGSQSALQLIPKVFVQTTFFLIKLGKTFLYGPGFAQHCFRDTYDTLNIFQPMSFVQYLMPKSQKNTPLREREKKKNLIIPKCKNQTWPEKIRLQSPFDCTAHRLYIRHSRLKALLH